MASVNKVRCPTCNGEFLRTAKQVNQVVKRSGVWRCKRCVLTERNQRNAKPIGSVRVHLQTGYLEEKTMSGWRRQHIAVMEMAIGRPLRKGEVVHHINENKTDNRIANLQIMTHGEHTALHNHGVKHSAETKMKMSLIKRRFTQEQALYVRHLTQNGTSQKDAALLTGMSQMTASRIARRITYQEVK